jgi:hypothetical protein
VKRFLRHWRAIGGGALITAMVAGYGLVVTQCGQRDRTIETRAEAATDLALWRAAVDRHIAKGEQLDGEAAQRLARQEQISLVILNSIRLLLQKEGLPEPVLPSELGIEEGPAHLPPAGPLSGVIAGELEHTP